MDDPHVVFDPPQLAQEDVLANWILQETQDIDESADMYNIQKYLRALQLLQNINIM
jgi:hypothetical protein